MSDDNLKIALWAGWRQVPHTYPAVYYPPGLHPMANAFGHTIPCFTTSDAEAISLLPVLVERGYGVSLVGQEGIFSVDIVGLRKETKVPISMYSGESTSIAAAISAAVLGLIDKEATNENKR